MEYQEIFNWGAEQLAKAGIEEAKLDARLLLEEVCSTDRVYLLLHGEESVTGEQEEKYRDFIKKRENHIPLQQITGYQEFMGLRFQVTPDVLVPRQDTETLVEEVMRYLHDGMRILDLCTGSGCILLSLLHYSNECMGLGSDISEKALEAAKENARQLGLDAEFTASNLFENIEGKFEIIVSNPPYIPSGVIPGLMEEVKDHEPLLALDGAEDGLSFYKRITGEAGAYLCPGGMLFFEIGFDQAEAVSGLMKEAGFKEVTVCKDLAGHDRVVHGIYGG